jgi:alpha-tubulin suppressor-like RCC1 family protein
VKALGVVLLLGLSTAGAVAADGTPPIAAGAYHACSALSGKLRCWGDNSSGELGNGTTRKSLTPVAVTGLPTPILEVAASYDRTCALVSGRRVYCWGRGARLDSSGKPKANSTPLKVSGIPSTAHGLAVGVTHACVVDANDAVWCWGVNDRGQIGDGTTKARSSAVKTKSPPAAKVVASDGYTCAVLRAGGVACWGRSHGSAGDPLNPEGLVVNSKTPLAIPGLETATDLSATGDFICVLLAGGLISAWGENDHGQLGDGTVTGRSVPAIIGGLPEAVQVVASASHACALTSDGSVFCWGRGDHGQLGDGSFAERHVPGPIVQPRPAAILFGGASGHWTLALASEGSAFAWGRDEYGQLGNRGTVDQAIPVDVTL